MSIESATSRIAELRARIDAMTQQPELAPQLPAPIQTPATVDATQSGTPLQPFNVALAQARGQAEIRPADSLGRFPDIIENLVQKYSDRYGLSPSVVKAVIRAESDGNPRSISNKGAMGLMQLMPDEVKAYGIADPFDAEQNIAGGTRQLAKKLKIFNGDLPNALAAYNAGSGAVQKYGGIPPYRETQEYVKRILSMVGR